MTERAQTDDWTPDDFEAAAQRSHRLRRENERLKVLLREAAHECDVCDHIATWEFDFDYNDDGLGIWGYTCDQHRSRFGGGGSPYDLGRRIKVELRDE